MNLTKKMSTEIRLNAKGRGEIAFDLLVLLARKNKPSLKFLEIFIKNQQEYGEKSELKKNNLNEVTEYFLNKWKPELLRVFVKEVFRKAHESNFESIDREFRRMLEEMKS